MTEIEGGRTRIATTTPIVTVTATDTLSGVDAVRLRVDEGHGATGSPPRQSTW